MIRDLLFLFCILAACAFAHEEEFQDELILSTPDQLASLTSKSSHLIGGLVSPLSGQLSLRKTDMVVKGAQSIFLTRTYIPPYMPTEFAKHESQQEEYDKLYLHRHLSLHYKGWQFFPHLSLNYDPKRMEVRACDPGGATLDFKLSGELVHPPYAISNLTGDEPSGQYDPRNTRFSYGDDKIVVFAPSGSTRHYQKQRSIFLLQKEVLPNGKVLKYHYNNAGTLVYVESLDPNERYVYASLRISGSPREGTCHFTSSSGSSVDYVYQRRAMHAEIKDKNKKHFYKETHDSYFPPILCVISSPFYRDERLDYCGRFLLSSYVGNDHDFVTEQTGFHPGPHYRVGKLSLPVGDAFQQVYSIDYEPPVAGEKEGWTRVKNDDGTSTIYRFSKDLLITTIQYFGTDGSLKKEKIYSWENNWLRGLELKDEKSASLYKKTYEYDRFGNPVVEVFKGDGNSYTIKREFSQDGRNLCLKEEHENGKTILWSYLPNTNLVLSKITRDHERTLFRDLYHYDDCNNLIQAITEDGSRTHITNYLLRNSPPFLHMPEVIEEKYVDNGTEKLLSRKHLSYDVYGNVSSEEVYDANSGLAYTLYKEWNERGNLLSETNEIGQKAAYTYDSRGRRTSETNFSGRLQKTMRYDTRGHLLEQKETGDDGVVHQLSFKYDSNDRLIQKTDHFGNVTSYAYDPIVNQVIRTDFPLGVSTKSSYDSFGREITRTDANGNRSLYRYNSEGSLIEAKYPDGGSEHFCYNNDGTLASHTNKDGLTIRYKRDCLGRVLSQLYGESLAEETFIYSGSYLISQSDREGNLTEYAYDGAGRKIRENISGRMTDFSYDSLGKLSAITAQNGDNTLITKVKRDLVGNILEEVKTGSLGRVLHKINFAYDADGNKSQVIKSLTSVDSFTYDSFGRLTEHKDPDNFATKYSYNENFVNELGQKVLQTTITNPRNITKVETKDALNRIAKNDVIDPQQKVLSSEEKVYDAHGNLILQKDHVYENGCFVSTKTIEYTYIPTHNVESMTMGNSNITRYTYYNSGKIKTKILPNGVILSYEYDPLGFLSALRSSDGAIQQTFEHNKLGYLIYAADKDIAISRTVDPLGNVLQETFPSKHVIDKKYDDFNRLVSLKISSLGEIAYSYDPLYLRKVTRLSGSDKLYTHYYNEYDQNGNLLSESLIENLGEVLHKTDQRGLKSSIASPYLRQECFYDAEKNLIETIIDGNQYHYTYDDLSQLTSECGPNHSSLYAYDSLYNRTNYKTNDLNQNISLSYDLNGNQTSFANFQLKYDPLNRLIEAISPQKKLTFTYDPLGRRLSKSSMDEREDYLYHGQYELGSISKNFRVPGLIRNNNPSSIAIELGDHVFATVLDAQGNVRKLINRTCSIADSYDFTAFGSELKGVIQPNPWRYASKRLDLELGLIYFGKRYYDPAFGRWLTQDPAGFVDSSNLYQYVFNNPFRYQDPHGESLVGFVCGIGQILLGSVIVGTGVALEVCTFGGYTFAFGVHEACGLALMANGCAMASYHAHDIQAPNISWKNTNPVDVGVYDLTSSSHTVHRKKKGEVDDSLSADPFNDQNLKDISHPGSKEQGRHKFQNKQTGEIIEYDEAQSGKAGHRGHNHYHKPNPNSTGRGDYYLDSKGNPIPKGSESSHLYPPDWVWWE